MRTWRKKPGLVWRALVAFTILNLALFITVPVVVWLAGGQSAEWWVRGIVAVAVTVCEFSIVTTTIGPPLLDWIKSEELVEEDDTK